MTHRAIALPAALLAALALAIAHAAESWGGLVPCALCLWERWPYRIVLGLSALATILPPRLEHSSPKSAPARSPTPSPLGPPNDSMLMGGRVGERAGADLASATNALARPLLWASCVALLAGVVLGMVHVGVEWHLWPSPLAECAAQDLSGLSIAERLARMPATPAKPCDEPVYLLPFLPLSMAMLNFLLALAMASGLVIALRRRQGGAP